MRKLKYLFLILVVVSVSAYLTASRTPDTDGADDNAIPAFGRAAEAIAGLTRRLPLSGRDTGGAVRDRMQDGIALLLASERTSSVMESVYPESDSLVSFEEARSIPTGQVRETVETDGARMAHIGYESEGEGTQIWADSRDAFFKSAEDAVWRRVSRNQAKKAAGYMGEGSLGYLLGSLGHERTLDNRGLLKGAAFDGILGEMAYKGYRYDLIKVLIPDWNAKVGKAADGGKLVRYEVVVWLRKGRRPLIDRIRLNQVYEEDGHYTYWMTDGTYEIEGAEIMPPKEIEDALPLQRLSP